MSLLSSKSSAVNGVNEGYLKTGKLFGTSGICAAEFMRR